MKKRVFLICMILVFACCLFACAAPVTFQTAGGSYEVTGTATSDGALGITPGAGSTLFVLTLKTDAQNLDDAQNSFFGINTAHSSVSQNGGQAYECKSLAFETDGSDVQTVLVFEVPADWASTKDFTLSGEGFGSVNLKQS